MRRPRPFGSCIGLLMIAAGIVVLLAMVLPSGFWWFLVGLALIVCGVCVCGHR